MQEKKTERAPGSYEDFVAYLGTVRTEEELFSPLTYWFVGQNCPEDVCFRPSWWRRGPRSWASGRASPSRSSTG